MVGRVDTKSCTAKVFMENNRHIPSKTPYNNQNAGELLPFYFLELVAPAESLLH